MCMQCVAGSAPYVSVGFALLRGRAIKDWVQVRRGSPGVRPAARPDAASAAPAAVEPVDQQVTTAHVDDRHDELLPLG